LSFEIENTFEESNKGPISPLQLSMDGEILENDFSFESYFRDTF
jgi:hypothetical protein